MARGGRVVPVNPWLRADERRCWLVSPTFCLPCAHGRQTLWRHASFAYGKTVWSWPSLLRSSFPRRWSRARPGRRSPSIRGARGRPEGTRLPGERGISRQTTAQGRPRVWLHLFAAVQFFLRATCARRSVGASRHPAFPAPSGSQEGGEIGQSSGETRRGAAKLCLAFRCRSRVLEPKHYQYQLLVRRCGGVYQSPLASRLICRT